MPARRRSSVSPQTLERLYAQIHKDDSSHPTTLVGWILGLGFVLLLISAPILIVLYLFTPYNFTVQWLYGALILGGIVFLAMLPGIFKESPWKALKLFIIVSLVGAGSFLFITSGVDDLLGQILMMIGCGLVYTDKAWAIVQNYQHTQRPFLLTIAGVFAIACFGMAGYYIRALVVPSTQSPTPFPVGLLFTGTYLINIYLSPTPAR